MPLIILGGGVLLGSKGGFGKRRGGLGGGGVEVFEAAGLRMQQ